MSIETKSVKDALEILKALCVDWVTVNKIENSLWETGLAFFDRSYCRVAYYDEVNHVLSINYEGLFQVRTQIFAKKSPILNGLSQKASNARRSNLWE